MIRTALLLVCDLLQFVALVCCSRERLVAENLFLRKQLAFYVERKVKPWRLNDAARIALVFLARVIDWRQLLVVVQPEILLRWHRQGFRPFWRWKSRRRGRPRIPVDLQDVITDMARANHTWGEERIAAELLLKLGVAVSSRTVRRYMRRPMPSRPSLSSQTWSTFVRNHAGETLACDFFVAVTATFRLVYVFLVLEIGTRRILHSNTTEHPTAEWTTQQFRSVLTGDEPYRFVIHDRDVEATIGPGHDEAIVEVAARHRLHATDPAWYVDQVVGDVQQYFHDTFVDTTWPSCPHHSNHPLWFSDGWWRCERIEEPIARLGALSGVNRERES